MKHRQLGTTDLTISPLVFGGNVFGWTLDEKDSHALLDEMVDRGLNTIDTADSYSTWVEGNTGGESETVIGNWLKRSPGKREKVILFTKVGSEVHGGGGLSKAWISQAVDASLRRLQTDYIDLYFTHLPDPKVPIEETLEAFQTLLKQGKIRAIGGSNLEADPLREALDLADTRSLPRYQVLQPEYNLYDRAGFEGPLQELCVKESIGVVPYFSLASGFLTGKYQTKADAANAQRAGMVDKYFDAKGERILAALETVSTRTGAPPAAIALAWLMAQDGVTAPIVSATSTAQLAGLFQAIDLELSSDDLATLTAAGHPEARRPT